MDRDTVRAAYAKVTFARQLDDKVHMLSRSGQAMIFWFPWHGTELVAAAIGLATRREDYLVSYYRDAASQLAKGSEPAAMFAEVMGKATGTQKGKSGFCHTIDLSANVVMNSGVVGGQLPIATGWALSSDIRRDGRVTICTLGDGAVNEGSFHESLTLAALWKLPIVYVCLNNLVAEHTVFEKTSPVERVADRAAAYGMPGARVDGGDFPATWQAMSEAVERARSGAGPTLVETIVHRARGHHHFDHQPYLSKEHLAAMAAADPVPRFRAWILEDGHATEDELGELDAQAGLEVEAAWEFAQSSPVPDVSELYTDVYAAAEGART
jgi:acetoin:2,6-dichlorophenolindophenol oxidoreductase subunit alpha